jgi:hypothetical protein
MARRRASTSTAALATAPRATNANDRTLYTHNLWLNYLKPVSLGLVFSSNALRAAQIELPLQAAEAQRALEALTIPRPMSDEEDVNQENPPRTLRDTKIGHASQRDRSPAGGSIHFLNPFVARCFGSLSDAWDGNEDAARDGNEDAASIDAEAERTWDGNEDAASIDAEAERTCIAMKSASRLTDQAQVPNPFKAKWFGSPSNAWVRVVELPVGGMF